MGSRLQTKVCPPASLMHFPSISVDPQKWRTKDSLNQTPRVCFLQASWDTARNCFSQNPSKSWTSTGDSDSHPLQFRCSRESFNRTEVSCLRLCLQHSATTSIDWSCSVLVAQPNTLLWCMLAAIVAYTLTFLKNLADLPMRMGPSGGQSQYTLTISQQQAYVERLCHLLSLLASRRLLCFMVNVFIQKFRRRSANSWRVQKLDICS